MPVRKKTNKKAPRPAKATPKSKLTVLVPSAQLARIETMVKRTLDVVEFLEGEIIKARDENSVDMAKKIEATPYDETT